MSWRKEATFIEIINDYIRYVLDQQVYFHRRLCSQQYARYVPKWYFRYRHSEHIFESTQAHVVYLV
jgi:hypothetical protein